MPSTFLLRAALVAAAVLSLHPRNSNGQGTAGTNGAKEARIAYDISGRVEVNYGGEWYRGTIIGARDGRYQVKRDDYSSDDRWVTAADIRTLTPPARKNPPSPYPIPREIPKGDYACTTIASGFGSSSSTSTTIGTLRITGPGAYTALAKTGQGAPSRFTYNASSGQIEWDGGKLKGFFGTVLDSRFTFDTQRVPHLVIVYRVREGGNLFDLSCRREGA